MRAWHGRLPIPENTQARFSQKRKENEDGLGKAAAVSELKLWYCCINSSWHFDFMVRQLLSLPAILPSADKANVLIFNLTFPLIMLSSILWIPFF